MTWSEFVDTYAHRSPDWGFNGLGEIVFQRTYAREIDGRKEQWHETLDRVIRGAREIDAGLTEEEERRLFDYMFNLKALPAGRMLWMLGTDHVRTRGGDALCNCWFTRLESPADFGFLFNQLMQGGGVGFSATAEDRAEWPSLKQGGAVHEETNDADFIVSDKREGWTALLEKTLHSYIDGTPFTYSTVLVRPEGTPIKTFGGTASGPGILIEGIRKITDVLDLRVGQFIRAIDLLDVANIIGSIVVAGNVRRSAQIAIGDVEDKEFLKAKHWGSGSIPQHRGMSNNTVAVDDIDELNDDFWDGYTGEGEPYGLFNLKNAMKYGRMGEERPDWTVDGVNPCAEIALANKESCNLAEIFMPNIDSQEEMQDVAFLLYKVQKAVAAMPFQDENSTAIIKTNMRLGLSVSGIAQSLDKLDWLSPVYEALVQEDKRWSHERGFPPSVRLTTVKPSGTISILSGVAPGVHPGFSQFHIRRVRMSSTDPLVQYCLDKGYHVEPLRSEDGRAMRETSVVEFPASFSEDTITAEEMGWERQLELVRFVQEKWADNSVSVTVYYEKDDLADIQTYLKDKWHRFKTLSFLLRAGHGFDQAPYEEITGDEYDRLIQNINDTHLSEVGDGLIMDDCEDGSCPVR